MSNKGHHREALIETAHLELERAHRAAKAMSAGEIRRGLDIALGALRDAGPDALQQSCIQRLEQALASLDAGQLSAVGTLIEQVRKDLETS